MKSTTRFCRLPGKKGYKWPTLSELHEAVFDKPMEQAHHAEADVQATADCFWELKQKGVLK